MQFLKVIVFSRHQQESVLRVKRGRRLADSTSTNSLYSRRKLKKGKVGETVIMKPVRKARNLEFPCFQSRRLIIIMLQQLGHGRSFLHLQRILIMKAENENYHQELLLIHSLNNDQNNVSYLIITVSSFLFKLYLHDCNYKII